MTSASIGYPACVCTAHPAGDDRRAYMYVSKCTNEYVVFCCKRCTEIERTPVIQVRTLGAARDRARWLAEQQRRSLPPSVLRMLMARKKGGVRIKEEQHES